MELLLPLTKSCIGMYEIHISDRLAIGIASFFEALSSNQALLGQNREAPQSFWVCKLRLRLLKRLPPLALQSEGAMVSERQERF